MSYFSFEKTARPIAVVDGGVHNKKLIFIGDDGDDKKPCCKKCMIGCGVGKPPCCTLCRGICHELKGGGIDDLFTNELKKAVAGRLPYIDIKDGSLIPIPKIVKKDELQRENIFVSGPEGSGKSTWASKFIKMYLSMYPKAKFFLFSGVSSDPPLDALNPIRIELNEQLIEEPLQPDMFPRQSIFLFDDINGLSNKKVQKEVQELRDRILEKGRHKALFVLSLNHNPTNGKETKHSLLESSSIVLFPKAGDTYHIERVLKTYLGYNKNIIQDILKLNTRWIQCHKRYPQFILHEHGAFFPK